MVLIEGFRTGKSISRFIASTTFCVHEVTMIYSYFEQNSSRQK